jgi:hypothetical protein
MGPRKLGWETVVALGLLAVGTGVGLALTRLATPLVPTPLGASTWEDWFPAWQGLLVRQWRSLAPGQLPTAVAAAVAVGLGSLAWSAARRQAPAAWRAALVLVLAAAVIWLYAGTREWVRRNGYAYRYLMPFTLLIELAALGVALGPIVRVSGPAVRRAIFGLAVLALFAGGVWTFGLPSIARVRADADRLWGGWTHDVLESRCTHLTGGYERIWPAAFHAYLVSYERGDGRIVWAVTGRSEATAPLWLAVPAERIRVAVPLDEEVEANDELRKFGFPPLVLDRRWPTLRIYRFDVLPDQRPRSSTGTL